MALVGHWIFDETSGNVALDLTGNGNNCALFNGAVQGVTGKWNKATQFDGVNDYGKITYNSIFNVTNLTATCWVKFPAKTDQARIFSCELGGTKGWGLVLQTGGGGNIAGLAYNGTTGNQTYTANGIALNTWYFIAFSVNSVTHQTKMYLNGAAPVVGPNFGTFTGSLNTVGADIGVGVYLPALNHNTNMIFDEARIYNTVLTDAEVLSLYNNNNENGPILCWNYKARYKNSNRLFTANGDGKFPTELKVPSSVDVSTGIMMDEGIKISADKYKVVQ